MSRDALNHLPAKSSTPVPRTFILPHLPNKEIHVSRYGLSPYSSLLRPYPLSDRGETSSPDGVLERLRDDPLERAWREVSMSGEEGLQGVLQGCGVVIQEQDAGRVLWVFSTKESGQDWAELEELLPRPPSLEPSRLFACPTHGHDLSCLSSKHSVDPTGSAGLTTGPSTSSCNLRWTTSRETNRVWSYLQDAVVEKLAWKAGRRVTVRRGVFELLGYPPFQPRLQPLPTGALLLTLVPEPVTGCHPTFLDSLDFRYRPFLLLPFGLPAIQVGPHYVSPVQAAKLDASFEQILGPRWEDNREPQRMATQLRSEVYSDYSVYWVPTLLELDQRLPVADSDPIELVEAWLKGLGVLTIWPTHLVFDLTPRPRSCLPHGRLNTPLDIPSTSDLMDVAADLFDLMSNYRDPPPAENTPPEVADLVTAVVGKRQPDISVLTDDLRKTSPADDKSDFDDLFSTRSASPGLSLQPGAAALDLQNDVASGLFGMSESQQLIITDGGPAASISAPRIRPAAEDTEEGDATFVTEDDFDFFDEPNDLPDVPKEEKPDAANEVNEDPTIDELHQAVPEGSVLELSSDRSSSTPSLVAPSSPTSQVRHEEIAPTLMPSSEIVSAAEVFEPSNPVPPPPSAPAPERGIISTRAVKRQFEDIEMVPEPFEPVELPHSDEQLLSLAYAFPSPAPTPESLRPELIERIQRTKREATKYDYASGWDVESEMSTARDDEAVAGAPPTPVSELDYDEDSVAPTPVAIATETMDDGDIEFEGVRCVGPEWAILRLDPSTLSNLAVPWRQSWPGGPKVKRGPPGLLDEGIPVAGEKKDEFFQSFDLSTLATALISNRFLRVTLARKSLASQVHPAIMDQHFDLAQETINLSELTRPWDEAKPDNLLIRPLPQCSVHTGFAGNVSQLAIAGLKFWQELGLQPVGGAKNVTAYVVCEQVPGMRRLGDRLSCGLKRSYEAMKLGSHSLGREHDATAGIIVTHSGGLCSTVSGISSTVSENTILYILVDGTSGRENILSLFCKESFIASPLLAVHVVPIDAVQNRDYTTIALDVYNRIPKAVRRVDVRGYSMDDHEPPVFMQYPRFTLAPTEKPVPNLSLAWPLRSYDVLSTWRLIHGAYSYSATTELLSAFVIDAEGDDWEVRIWPLKRDHPMTERIEAVWGLLASFASRAAIEYRIAVCSLGHLTAWNLFGPAKKIPFTLVMTDPPRPTTSSITRPSPQSSSLTSAILHDPSSRMIDESLLAHTATLSFRQSLPLPGRDRGEAPIIVFPKSTFLLSMATPSSLVGEWTTATYHVLNHRAAPGKEGEEVDELLSGEYYRLTCLGSLRFRFEGGLPAHLEAVRCVQECFEGLIAGTEG